MSSAGYSLEHATTARSKPTEASDILAEIKADYVDCRSILLDFVRARAPARSTITGNESKLGDGAKELESTLSSIIANLNNLQPKKDIPLDSLNKKNAYLLQMEKMLREKVAGELMDSMIDKNVDVDYNRVSRNATSIYNEIVAAYRE